MHHVLIEGLEVYAYHGVSDAEREVGHRYMIDLDMEVEGDAPTSDAITGTVDYGEAGQLVAQVVSKNQFHTVERLGREIGSELLRRFALVTGAEIVVMKPNPPAPIIAASAGAIVRVER